MTSIDTIHTVAGLMKAAGIALAERDGYALERMQDKASQWLQPSAESEAQMMMLQAMTEAAYMLEDEPSELTDTAA